MCYLTDKITEEEVVIMSIRVETSEERVKRAREIARVVSNRGVTRERGEKQLEDLNSQMIDCLECGRRVRNSYLPEHVLRHEMNLEMYLDKYFIMMEQYRLD